MWHIKHIWFSLHDRLQNTMAPRRFLERKLLKHLIFLGRLLHNILINSLTHLYGECSVFIIVHSDSDLSSFEWLKTESNSF